MMSLFQNSVLNEYLQKLDKQQVEIAYNKFIANFGDIEIQNNIRKIHELQYQGGFLRELFVDILGYTINPQPNYNLTTEYKNEKDAKRADGAIIKDNNSIAVIELKGTNTPDLETIVAQAFNYKNHQNNCKYIITSNFEKLRFYIENANDYNEFNLFNLSKNDFDILFLCLSKDNLLNDLPFKIKQKSLTQEENITKQLYNDYSIFKGLIFSNIVKLNPQYEKLLLYKKTQKLLDRFLFMCFAEDRLLLPANYIRNIVNSWQSTIEEDYYISLYDSFIKHFNNLDIGFKGKEYEIFAYNGGLFEPDEILDNIKIDDQLLKTHTFNLSKYDYKTEVDVNILGHIFEHSLNENEEVQAKFEGQIIDKNKTRRKKEGVFYTPKYITKYIVDNTLGFLCDNKKKELGICEDQFTEKNINKRKKILFENLKKYRKWLLELTICDPACGSGAFLNQALNYLIEQHKLIAELEAKILGNIIVLQDIENKILENNLYGVDLNDESIEIAKLSLWLRTAQRKHKLTSLNKNIRCGNSLIDNPIIAGEKAFNWHNEFPEIFAKGGFDVIIGNPPYGAIIKEKEFYSKQFGFKTNCDSYQMFTILAPKLINKYGICGFIIPNSWMNRKKGNEFRKKLFNYNFYFVIDFVNQVFTDANIDTCILIYSNNKNTNKNKTVLTAKVIVPESIISNLVYTKVNFENWIKYDKFNCELTDITFKIFKKLKSNSNKLGKLTTITGGYKPYQVGYGKSISGNYPQTEDDVENWVYHSKIKKDDTYFPDIKGGNIQYYYIKPNTQWVKWGNWLMSPKKKEDFINPKIVVREVAGIKLNACYDDSGYFTNDTTHIIRGVDSNILKFLLTIINSKLIGWYFRKFYGEANELFPKIKVNELKDLPIKINSITIRKPFIIKAESILFLSRNLFELKTKFLKLLTSKYSNLKISNKLEDWEELDFKGFLKELERQKIKLTLIVQLEWLDFFDKEKIKVQEIKTIIKKTVEEIDTMVYKLYNITTPEQDIIEDKNNKIVLETSNNKQHNLFSKAAEPENDYK